MNRDRRSPAIRAAEALTSMVQFLPPSLATTISISSTDGRIEFQIHDLAPIRASLHDGITLADWLFDRAYTYQSRPHPATGDLHHVWSGTHQGLPTKVAWVQHNPPKGESVAAAWV